MEIARKGGTEGFLGSVESAFEKGNVLGGKILKKKLNLGEGKGGQGKKTTTLGPRISEGGPEATKRVLPELTLRENKHSGHKDPGSIQKKKGPSRRVAGRRGKGRSEGEPHFPYPNRSVREKGSENEKSKGGDQCSTGGMGTNKTDPIKKFPGTNFEGKEKNAIPLGEGRGRDIGGTQDTYRGVTAECFRKKDVLRLKAPFHHVKSAI